MVSPNLSSSAFFDANSFDASSANKRLVGEEFEINLLENRLLIDYSIPIGKKFFWVLGIGSFSGDIVLTILLNTSTRLAMFRSNWTERNCFLQLPLRFDEGDRLQIFAKNVTFQEEKNDASFWLYGKEEII